jgi:hypothetical protein
MTIAKKPWAKHGQSDILMMSWLLLQVGIASRWFIMG